MPPSSLRLPSQCDGVLDRAQALEGMAAARLEAVKDRPQMLVYVLLHKQDTVEVVGHKLKSNNGNIVITLLYLIPAGGYCHPQLRRHSPGRTRAIHRQVGIANDSAENGLAPFGCHRHHVHPAGLVVVVLLTAEH